MLVLSRKPQQAIQIGKDIRVVILKTTNGTVKIGIDAPAEIAVRRGELADPTPHPEHLSLVLTRYEELKGQHHEKYTTPVNAPTIRCD